MREFQDHSLKGKTKRIQDAIDAKMIVSLLVVELSMYLMALLKGVDNKYLPIVLSMMAFTIVGCILVNCLHADKILFAITLVLLNLGFLIQQVTNYNENQMESFLKKFVVAMVTALFTGLIFSKIKRLLATDIVITGMMLLQIVIGVFMFIFGQLVGDAQGAIISWQGMTPFEIVKLLYIFVCAGLLCDEGKKNIYVMGRRIDREFILVLHTLLLVMIFIGCSELGTMMIIYITGLIMLWVYGKNQKWIFIMILVSVIGFLAVWFLSTKVFLPLMTSGEIALPGPIAKIIRRFGSALHPELYMQNYGYQGTNGLQAIAIGGWLGIPAKRYRVKLPEATNDFMFANLIQTCGVLMGFVVVLFFFAFLRNGLQIAERSSDAYLKKVASAITFMIISEALIHIGYNMAVFPITGIPLYFVSQGFTAIVTGMLLVAILLVISLERSGGSHEK